MSQLNMTNNSSPATPVGGKTTFFINASGNVATKDAAGDVREYSPTPLESESMVYGVRWDSTSGSPACEPGVLVSGSFVATDYQNFPIQEEMKRGLLTSSNVFTALHERDSSRQPDGSTATLDGSSGQTHVQVPRFYVVITRIGDYVYVLNSKQPFTFNGVSAWVPKEFRDDSYRYIGAFECVAATDAVDAAAQSIVKDASGYTTNTNPNPFTDRTRGQFRTQIADGVFYQSDWGILEIILILFLTEFKTWNSQQVLPGHTEVHTFAYGFATPAGATLGLGNFSGSIWTDVKVASITVDGADDASAFSVGETVTGGTSGATGVVVQIDGTTGGKLHLDEVSGSFTSGETITGGTSGASATEVSTSSTDGRYIANSFRGIENPFGNVWILIDGININNPTGSPINVYVCHDPADFADDTTTNYTDTGLSLDFEDDDDYIKDIYGQGDLAAFYPIEIGNGAGSGSYITDYHWNSAGGWRVLQSGGTLSTGAQAGLASLGAFDGSGTSASGVGARAAA